MKLQLFQTLLLFVLISLTFSTPIKAETSNEIETSNKLVKRYDVNTYLHSIGHFFTSSDIKRNVFYYEYKNLDIYYSKKNVNSKNPVVIYIYGGSWYLGEKSLYTKLGEALRDSGFITVIPNYIQFPFGTLDEMTHDISEAIKWVYNNIHSYGGDRDNIIVLGHSSGAHLTALTLLRSSLGLEVNSSAHYITDMPRIKRAVLLNGPYDFDLLSSKLKETGNKPENSGTEAFLKAALNSKDACPTEVLKKYKDKSIKYLGADLIVLMHAEEDATVPVLSSYELLDEIKRTSYNPATIYLTHGYYHCGITEGVMNGDKEAQRLLIRGLLDDDLSDDGDTRKNENYINVDDNAKDEAKESAGNQAETTSNCPSGLSSCNGSCYDPLAYNCENGQLCPVGLKNCNGACYSPNEYHCENGNLIYGPASNNNNNNNNNNGNSNSNSYYFNELENNAKSYQNNNDYWFEEEDRKNQNNSPFFWK